MVQKCALAADRPEDPLRVTADSSVSLIVPTRNEAGNVKALLDRLGSLLPSKASFTDAIRYLRQLASLRVNDTSRRAMGFAAVGGAGIGVNMAAVITLTLTGTSRLWHTAGGEIAWFALIVAAAYLAFSVISSARKY